MKSSADVLIVKWPGVTKPDFRSDQMVQNLDYAQTFLEMAGVEIPANMQGRSLVPILKNGKLIIGEKVFITITEYPSVHGSSTLWNTY